MKKNHGEMVYEKYSVYKLTPYVERLETKGIRLYHNDYEEPALGEIFRVRTEGEVFRCINCFMDMGIICRGVYCSSKEALAHGKKVIYTYPKKFDYYQVKDDRLRCSSQCVVAFERKEEDRYFVDKISYIVSYLNHRYPEYRWIGVY
jgi:hypothetical protein